MLQSFGHSEEKKIIYSLKKEILIFEGPNIC